MEWNCEKMKIPFIVPVHQLYESYADVKVQMRTKGGFPSHESRSNSVPFLADCTAGKDLFSLRKLVKCRRNVTLRNSSWFLDSPAFAFPSWFSASVGRIKQEFQCEGKKMRSFFLFVKIACIEKELYNEGSECQFSGIAAKVIFVTS